MKHTKRLAIMVITVAFMVCCVFFYGQSAAMATPLSQAGKLPIPYTAELRADLASKLTPAYLMLVSAIASDDNEPGAPPTVDGDGTVPPVEGDGTEGGGEGTEGGGEGTEGEGEGTEGGGEGTEGDGDGTEGDGTEGDGDGTEGDGTEGDGTEGDGTEGDGAKELILLEELVVEEPADSAQLLLTADCTSIEVGQTFNLITAFEQTVSSNASILTYSFDPQKFVFQSFTPAENVSVVSTILGEGSVTLTVMVLDYETLEYGSACFTVKEDADLSTEENVIQADVDYVFKDENEEKSTLHATASITLKVPEIPDFSNMTLIDLSNLIDVFGITKEDELWAEYAKFDFDNDGEIGIFDISSLAQLIKYD